MPSSPTVKAPQHGTTARNEAHSWFQNFANSAAAIAGNRWSFLGAVAVILIWAAVGPYFHYSDTWQLVINTATTIVTFLMVFLIQNTQNRDARALHLKLDELIRALRHADDEMIDVEKLSDEELDHLANFYERIRKEFLARKESEPMSK